MQLKEYAPGPLTRSLVLAYRLVHFALRHGERPAVKVYTPTPENCLQLFVRDREVVEYPDGRRVRRRCALVGAHDFTVRRLVPEDFLMVQVVFEPGALYRLTGVPATELRNQYIEASDLLGPESAQLADRLQSCSSYAEMVLAVERFIVGLASRREAPRDLLRPLRALRDDTAASIDGIARRCGLSLRQFERLCRERTGYGPKAYARLARFDKAFHAKLQRPDLDWLSIAIASGYHDYQHMAREFRSLAGHTPPALLATQSSAPERLLGLRQEFDLSYGIDYPGTRGP